MINKLIFSGQNEANQIFNKLSKNGTIIFKNEKKIISKLFEDIYITYRPLSKSGPPTIDYKTT